MEEDQNDIIPIKVDPHKFQSSLRNMTVHAYHLFRKRIEVIGAEIRNLLQDPFFMKMDEIPQNITCSFMGVISIDVNQKYSNLIYRNEVFLNINKITIEDHSGRAYLVGDFPFPIITGIVVGVTGKLIDGFFYFDEIYLPSEPKLHQIHSPSDDLTERKSPKILLVSNLSSTNIGFDIDIFNKLVEFANENADLIIFAGNTFSRSEGEIILGESQNDWIEWLEIMDFTSYEKFNEILKAFNAPKVVVPGFGDPVDAVLPTQAISQLLVKDESAVLTGNPTLFSYLQKTFIVMSEDSIKHAQTSTLSFHETFTMLPHWRSWAPSAGYSIQVSTSYDREEFFVDSLPDFAVAGGAPRFEFSEFNGCCLISVPDFFLSHSAVILDFDSDPHEVNFDIS